MKNIHIENSYKIWSSTMMYAHIMTKCYKLYNSIFADEILNRSWEGMYVEWWLHNIGYWVTKPFCFIEYINKINLRCKDVDLEEHK